jgi:hypothetical protein
MNKRLQKAIREGGATQVTIAEYCGVSEQAVARWKALGQISSQNLFALSELTGFRYLYLRDGTGPEKYDRAVDNEWEYCESEGVRLLRGNSPSESNCGELESLLDSIRRGYFGGRISKAQLVRLKGLVDVM